MTLQDPINLDILRPGWGIVTAYVLWQPVASASYRKRLWGLSAVLAILALGGLRTWIRNPTLDSWLSFWESLSGPVQPCGCRRPAPSLQGLHVSSKRCSFQDMNLRNLISRIELATLLGQGTNNAAGLL